MIALFISHSLSLPPMNSGTIGSPKIWEQYMNNKDCSKGFCSLYCPQWCYVIFPPPPPFQDFSDESSATNFSPPVIAIIAVLAGAFLLVSYYAIISKYCTKRFSSSTRHENIINYYSSNGPDTESGDEIEPSVHEPWFVATNGLDEALIRSIAVFKYRRGDRLIEGSDCSVCLSEFRDDESLRLLPKCCHAFHVECIDTWLKCHSNCPLCRANVTVSPSSLDPPLPGEASSGSYPRVAEDVESQGTNAPRIGRSSSMDCIRETRRGLMMKRSHSSGRCFFSNDAKTPNSEIPL